MVRSCVTYACTRLIVEVDILANLQFENLNWWVQVQKVLLTHM